MTPSAEVSVLVLGQQGLTTAAIAQRLGIKEETSSRRVYVLQQRFLPLDVSQTFTGSKK